jgi:DnaJ family protein A protein 2
LRVWEVCQVWEVWAAEDRGRARTKCKSTRSAWRNSTRAKPPVSLPPKTSFAETAKEGTTTHTNLLAKGVKIALRPVGPGLVTQEQVPCSTCSGRGSYFPDDKKCKKCKGARTTSQRKILELYIPPGSRQGDKIVLAGEADQVPDQEPGDIIFELVETPHEVFHRAGSDLQAELKVSLQEALTGFNRVVLKHLDGRGISLHVKQPAGRILRPGEVLKISGEGMPIKRSDAKGDLYLIVDVIFPEDGWLRDEATIQKIRDVLPKTGEETITAEEVDEVDWEIVKDMEDFGAGSGDPRAAGWEDDSEEEGEAAQCAQQ